MADSDTPQLPAQAQTGLPGAAQQAADITQAPPATDVLGPAAYGDKGWQQYQDLQRAGQQSATPPPAPMPTPSPTPSLPGDPSASGLNYLLGGGGAAMPSPLLDLLGGPGSAMKYQNQVMQQQQQAVQLQQKRQALAANGFAFLDSLRKQNVPLQLRAPMIQQWAAQQGMPIDPIQAAYIAQWGNDPKGYQEHLLHQIQAGGAGAIDAAEKWDGLFSNDYNRMVGASDAARIDKAKADAAAADAELKQRQAKQGPTVKSAYQGERAAAIQSLASEGNLTPNEAQIEQRRSDLANKEAQAKAAQVSAKKEVDANQETRKNIEAIRQYLNNPKFDSAVKSALPSTGGMMGGVAARASAATGGFGSIRSGDPDAAYLDQARSIIINQVRADALGTKGLRINLAELGLLGNRSQELANLNMTAPQALAWKKQYLGKLDQIEQTLDKSEKATGVNTRDVNNAQIAKPSTPEEAAALPPGTLYLKPDGKVYRR